MARSVGGHIHACRVGLFLEGGFDVFRDWNAQYHCVQLYRDRIEATDKTTECYTARMASTRETQMALARPAHLLPRDSALPMLFRHPRQFIKTNRWALFVLVLGAGADVFTTLWNLRAYGAGVEVHLVQRWVSQIVGIEAGVPLAKVGQLAFVVLVAAWWRPWCRWILLACGCLYATAAMSNYFLWI
jgi:hypothetical protein